MIDIDKEVFKRNLLFTQAYCELQMQKPFTNNAEVLRSFNPEYKGELLFRFIHHSNWNETIWHEQVDPSRDRVYYLELYKDQLRYKKDAVSIINEGITRPGKILIAEIDITLLDGASEAESDGLIDVFDHPPIDSWFYISENQNGRVLFAWIPEQFVEAVDRAIAVNCVDCLYWYNEPVNITVLKQRPLNGWMERFMKALQERPLKRRRRH